MFRQLIGQSLDRYQVLSPLGEGRLGATFKAHDPTLQRDVALKVLDLQRAGPPDLAERLLQRARLAARLDHPGLVRVHDFGRTENLLYIVMEFIPGGNLRQLLQDLRASNQWLLLSEAVQAVRQLGLVLQYANTQGAPPRRVRPSDIMLKPDSVEGLPYRPVLTDLGLDDATSELPPEGESATVGRPGYAYWSPEQALGEAVDARSQVYSLGVLLYELAVGWQPFPVKNAAEAVRAHSRTPAPPPRGRRADLPVPLEGVILKALEKDPAARYEDPAALAQALQDVLPLAREAEAQPGTANWAVSLLVPYQRSLFVPSETSAQQPLPQYQPPANLGRVRVVAPDGSARYVPLRPYGLTIGRHPDNDLVLDDPAVSAHHARVEFDNQTQTYRVIDLNSQTGTAMAGLRLLPGVPEAWRPDTPLLVGGTWLHLEPPQAAAAPRRSFFRFDGITVDANLVQSSPGAGRVGVYLEVPQLTVNPGQKVTAGLVVINQGSEPDRFLISVEGVPTGWIAAPAPPPSLQVPPGGYQRLRVSLEPPRSPLTRAGRYNLVVRVASQDMPDQVVDARVALAVTAFAQYHSELSATAAAVNEPLRLSVHNQGNTQVAYTITFEDPQDELAFNPPAVSLTVPEGQVGVVDFSAAVQRPRLIGGSRAHPFAVRVAPPADQPPQVHSAELHSRALVPPWVPLLLLFMCCLLTGVAAFAYNDYNTRAQATGTAAARQTTDAIAAADSDQDGLSNADEVRLGTDPLHPDSDADGLLDGGEVTWGSNALVADTDGDTLSDGREVNELQTSPINPDTDGDGQNDNVDPDPGQLPTPTASATPSATVTGTAVPPTATATAPTATPTSTGTPAPATATASATATPTLAPPTATLTLAPPTATNTLAPPTATTGAPLPNVGGIILFESRRDGRPEIYLMRADGSDQARLTNDTPNNGSDSAAAWSPTTSRIAFQSDRDGNFEIYVMNADGSGQTRLTDEPAADTAPAWSPDGARLAFVSERDGNPEIYVMNADGTGQTRLTSNTAGDFRPLWAPNGSRLLFESERDGNREIYVMNPDGSAQTRLTNNTVADTLPAWAPNSTWIAFVSARDGNNEIYLMNADGTGQLRLTNSPAADGGPVWSPNGARLAFVSERDGNPEIYTMLPDGSDPRRLTNHAALDAGPVWAPNAEWIAFRSERDGNSEVYIVDDGGDLNPVRLTDEDEYDAPLVWRP